MMLDTMVSPTRFTSIVLRRGRSHTTTKVFRFIAIFSACASLSCDRLVAFGGAYTLHTVLLILP